MQRSDYLIRKITFAILTLLVVIIFNFFLFRILPGDPVKLIVHSPRMTAEAQERIRVNFGLDKPVWFNQEGLQEEGLKGAFDTQFTAYVRNLLKGDLGVSFSTRRDVTELLKERTWRTVILVVLGEFLAIFLGIALGMIAAWRRGSNLDTGILLYGLFTWAMPTFFFGIILLMLSGGRFPIGGMVSPGLKPEDGLVYWKDVGRHLVLPTVTLTILYMSEYMLIMRSSVVEVLSEDFILTAKAKGLNAFPNFSRPRAEECYAADGYYYRADTRVHRGRRHPGGDGFLLAGHRATDVRCRTKTRLSYTARHIPATGR